METSIKAMHSSCHHTVPFSVSKILDQKRRFAQRYSNWSLAMRLVTLTFATLIATMAAADANAPRGRAENRTGAFDAQVKACNDAVVLDDIKSRFNGREKTDWKTNLELTSIHHVHTIGFRSNGRDLIPRRFCTARATLANGKTHALTYNISEDGGFSGWHGSFFWGSWRFPTPGSYHLEWCVSGLDRHHTYSPSCVLARP
jgi:hypothetical protein